MKKFVQLFFLSLLVLSILISPSCQTKKYVKTAVKYEQSGFTNEAFKNYYAAVERKKDYIDAKIGLKRTGQTLLNKELAGFKKYFDSENYQSATKSFEKAVSLYAVVKNAGVELEFPDEYETMYNESKDNFIADSYQKAIKHLDEGNYKAAENLLSQIVKRDKNYKDAQEKMKIAVSEPIYLRGIEQMENDDFITAYWTFNKINDYKDVDDLQDECIKKASVIIVIKPVTGGSIEDNKSLETLLYDALKQINDPFITITQAAPNQTDFKVINLSCKITEYNYNVSDVSTTKTKGWLQVTKKGILTGDTYTEYDKIYYYVCKQNATLKFGLEYAFTDAKSNKVVKTNFRSFNDYDEIEYVNYKGDTKNLFPGYWKKEFSLFSNDEDYIDVNGYQKLQGLVSARREITFPKEKFGIMIYQVVNLIKDDATKIYTLY